MNFLRRPIPAAMGFDLEGARMELDRRQLELTGGKAQSRFKMPFAGQWISSLQLAEGVTEYPVSAGQELAVVRDLHSVLLRVPLEDVSWSGLPTAKLTAVLPLGGRHASGGGVFAFKKLEKFQMREEVFYYFQFPFEESAAAAQLVGTSPTCELWLGLSQPARIVPKLALVLQEPEAFQNRRWNEGWRNCFPVRNCWWKARPNSPSCRRCRRSTRTCRIPTHPRRRAFIMRCLNLDFRYQPERPWIIQRFQLHVPTRHHVDQGRVGLRQIHLAPIARRIFKTVRGSILTPFGASPANAGISTPRTWLCFPAIKSAAARDRATQS